MSLLSSLINDNVGILFVSSSLYGTFLVLFIISSFVLHRQIAPTKLNSSGPGGTSIYLVLGYLLFFTITLSWVLSWIAVIKPSIAVAGPNQWRVLMFIQNGIGWLAILVADWTLAFRLYIIWERKKAILWAAAVMTIGYLVIMIREVIFHTQTQGILRDGIKSLVVISLCMNISVTAAIIWNLWKKTRLTRALGGWRTLMKVMAILIESAALYMIWMLVYLILYFMRGSSSRILLYGSPEIAGIATTLINIRIGLGWGAGEEGRITYPLYGSAFVEPDGAIVSESLGVHVHDQACRAGEGEDCISVERV